MHHIIPFDNTHFIINHPTSESGLLFTALEGRWCTHLRTKEADGKMANHCAATKRGIVYEAAKFHGDNMGGIYNPFNHKFFEYKLPTFFGYTHTGADPAGDVIFYENLNYEGTAISRHTMSRMVSYSPDGNIQWETLMGNRETFGSRSSQKSHFHPRFSPDRSYILFTGGCHDTKTNHVYLLDASQIPPTKNLPDLSE